MKISQKQASLLASEILKQLEKKNVTRISDHQKARIIDFVEKREALQELVDEAKKKLDEHKNTLKKITGNPKSSSWYNVKDIIAECEKTKTPTHAQIENKIILKSMFATDTDLETFIEMIAKEFTPKKQVTVS